MTREFPFAGIEKLCQLFGLSRDAFYKAENRVNQQYLQDALVLEKVREIKKDLPLMGTEKVYEEIKPFLYEHGIKMGRDKLYALLRTYHLLPKRKRKRPGTTQSRHRFYKYPNLTKGLEVLRPNQLWTSDITYIRCGFGFSYLSLITDTYSRKIIGWSLQPSLRAEGPIKALKMALKQRSSTAPVIHHSDKGIQYCCREYIALIDKPDIRISMAQEVYQNPIAERVNGILKTEFLRPGYPNHQMALAAVERAIWIYNTLRPHRSINMLKPVDAHQLSGPLAKRWKKNIWREKAKAQKNTMKPKKFLSFILS